MDRQKKRGKKISQNLKLLEYVDEKDTMSKIILKELKPHDKNLLKLLNFKAKESLMDIQLKMQVNYEQK